MKSWYCELIRDFDGTYYANLVIDGRLVLGLPAYVNYKTLHSAIKERTGIQLPPVSQMHFCKLGRKQEAIIDGTRTRPDCRVPAREIKDWRPEA